MEESQGVGNLFFELASESRLQILCELKQKSGKMNEIAKRLNLTTTESFRQFQRLSEQQLIRKQSDGSYVLSEYGKLILHLTPTLEFVYQNKDYFSTRDIWKIPDEFLSRIGELSSGTLSTNVTDSINLGEKMAKEAEEYFWAIGDKALNSIGPLLFAPSKKGVEVKTLRFIFADSLTPLYRPTQEQVGMEQRTLPAIPALIACTKKEAAICLLTADDKVDYAGFFGTDPVFRKWVEDLFLHFWAKGKRVIPGTS